VQSPRRPRDPGGTDASTDTEEPSAPTPGTADAEGRAGDDAPGVTDPVKEVRESLGWGELDRDAIKPRRPTEGSAGDQEARASSNQTVLNESVPLMSEVAITARRTDLGEYMQTAYTQIRDRWFDLDLTAHDKALGIGGQVTLEFVITRNGRVQDLRVVSSSGHPSLDQLALEAVPKHLPRLPRKLGVPAVRHRMLLRYRNPLVSPRDRG